MVIWAFIIEEAEKEKNGLRNQRPVLNSIALIHFRHGWEYLGVGWMVGDWFWMGWIERLDGYDPLLHMVDLWAFWGLVRLIVFFTKFCEPLFWERKGNLTDVWEKSTKNRKIYHSRRLNRKMHHESHWYTGRANKNRTSACGFRNPWIPLPKNAEKYKKNRIFISQPYGHIPYIDIKPAHGIYSPWNLTNRYQNMGHVFISPFRKHQTSKVSSIFWGPLEAVRSFRGCTS